MKLNTTFLAISLALTIAFTVGCGVSETSDSVETTNPESSSEELSGSDSTGSDTSEGASESGVVKLSPANTTIQFVGNHTGEDKKPRTCTFEAFTGTISGDGKLEGLSVEIDTDSLAAEIPDLTNHLKNADFFDVKRYPKAKFEATSVEAGDDGMVNITGDLTLLGQTHALTFPAKFSPGATPMLTASFEVDRTQWGMNYGEDKIEKMVEMTITVGK